MLTLQSKVLTFQTELILLYNKQKSLKISVLKSSNTTAQLNYMLQVQNLLLPNVQPGALTCSKSLKMHLLTEKSKLPIINYLGKKSYRHMVKK